jgi:hypothetical protein
MTTTPSQLSPALDDQSTLESAIECLSTHLPISMEGGYTVRELFEILVRAASRGDSIEQTTRALKGTPSGNGVRYHLDKLADMATLEGQLNTALHSRIPPQIHSTYHRLAGNVVVVEPGCQTTLFGSRVLQCAGDSMASSPQSAFYHACGDSR